MSFYAQLSRRSDISTLRREQAVSSFIEDSAKKLATQPGLFQEVIESAFDDLGEILARSLDGRIEKTEREAFERRHPAAYQALRRAHLLSVSEGVARLEIDDIAEHLAGRHVDIEVDLSCWAQIKQSPLRVGALRSALEQLAARDPTAARGYLDRLAQELLAGPDHTRLSLLCSVILANEDLEPLFDLAKGAAAGWDRDSIELNWGAGMTLLDMLSSERWPAVLRVQLLWKLAHLEDGHSWRHKEWRAHDAAAPARWNDWRIRFLNSVEKAGAPGLQFLLQWFSSKDALADSKEANLGDLARGSFFAVAHGHLREAIELLAESHCWDLLRDLALNYPAQVLEVLRHGLGALSLPQAVMLVEATLPASSGNEASHELATGWLDKTATASVERRGLLRVLTSFGDPAASMELVRLPSLMATEVATLARLPLKAFKKAISVVVKRKDINFRVLESLYVPPDLVEPYARTLFSEWATSPPPDIGLIVETLCRVAEEVSPVPAPVYQMINLVLVRGTPEDRRTLAYFAVPWSRARRPTGLTLHVLDEMCKKETDHENLQNLAWRLMRSTLSEAEVETYLNRLDSRFPGGLQLDEIRGRPIRFLE